MAEAMYNIYKKKGTSTYFNRTDCILLAVSVLIFGKFGSVSLATEKKNPLIVNESHVILDGNDKILFASYSNKVHKTKAPQPPTNSSFN